MDPIDAFPEHISTTVVPMTLPDKPDVLEYAARQAKSELASSTKSPPPNGCLSCFVKTIGIEERRDRLLKITDKRMVYIYGNIFFAKKDFTFGLRTVKSGEIHLIQTTHVPMLTYELPASSLKCRAQPNVIRSSFRRDSTWEISNKMKKFDQTPYKLPPPTPIHVPAKKRPLEEKSLPFSKKRVRITPVMRRVTGRPELPMALVQIPHVLEPVQIPFVPQPPVQIPHVTEPPAQIPVSQVPQPSVQISVSQVPQPPVQIPHVPEPPVQILQDPEPMRIPRAQHFGAFGVNGCTRPTHVVRIWTPSPTTPAASHGTLYF
ncbi:hypothetical protein TNCV_4245521 [Trichonephila clavipes]|nr:hypothetical protein TNCV_4245521 [Trichonephila clavipes]